MHLRRLDDRDSMEELTNLLHRAYAPLAAQGLLYVASHQTVETTRRRIQDAECWVAVDRSLIGTITLYPPARHRTSTESFYDEAGVASFGQFGVEPSWKGRGVGRALMNMVEARAREIGATELACDTAEGAGDLIAMYERRGYRFVQFVDWRPHTNYRSVLLSLRL